MPRRGKRALTTALERLGAGTVTGGVTRKMALALAVWDALLDPKKKPAKDWLDAVRWLYAQIDGPPARPAPERPPVQAASRVMTMEWVDPVSDGDEIGLGADKVEDNPTRFYNRVQGCLGDFYRFGPELLDQYLKSGEVVWEPDVLASARALFEAGTPQNWKYTGGDGGR